MVSPPSDRQDTLNLYPIAVKHTLPSGKKENTPSATLEISGCPWEEAGVLQNVVRQLSPAEFTRGIPK